MNRRFLFHAVLCAALLSAILAGSVVLGSVSATSSETDSGTEPGAGTDAEAFETLRSPSEFSTIEADRERSAALFKELSKVLHHPRCVNCHPSGDAPLQGDEMEGHQPYVRRGVDGFGVAGMRCNACHHGSNFEPGRIPGAPHWHLAPRSMAWEGLTTGEICAQLKDPKRNGGRDLEAIIKHMRDDPLVGWAWDPGTGREPAPGTQERFGELLRAWVDAGAACP